MRQSQLDAPFKIPGSESPLKKSVSVTAVLQGVEDAPNNRYYVDSLQRFKRDHASVDLQERALKKQREEDIRSRKRNQTIERDMSYKKLDEGNFQKYRDRQSNSLKQFTNGSKLTIHSYGTPIDPVNLKYQNTEKGRQLQAADKDKRLNSLVRAHKIQTFGSSGYNIINGQRNMTVQEMVPQENFGPFQQRLNNYYQKFRIRPDGY